VARAIASRLNKEHGLAIGTLGLDIDVVEAAALAHDLGHPPFGHIGETVLDELALAAGLMEGFEGNAQSFRIVTHLEARDANPSGLDLTAATRAAILKYPWYRPAPPTDTAGGLDKDALDGRLEDRSNPDFRRMWRKFSAYRSDKIDFDEAKLAHPEHTSNGGTQRQTAEASIMDLADDITYAFHDLEDFYQARMFDGTSATQELSSYLGHWLTRPPDDAKESTESGASVARYEAKLQDDYRAMFKKSLFESAVRNVIAFLNGVYKQPYTGQLQQVGEMRTATAGAISNLLNRVEFNPNPGDPMAPYVTLAPEPWHEVQVLKHLTQRFIIERADIAVLQTGQKRVLRELGEILIQWPPEEYFRLPRRIADGYAWAASPSGTWQRLGLAQDNPVRAVIDFLALLTDHQAYELHRNLTGQASFVVTGSVPL
jgi:dGTPase